MAMLMYKKKVIFYIFCSIFIILLFWPFYGIVAYIIFPETVNAIFVLLLILLEMLLGITIITFIIKNRKTINRKVFSVIFISVCILFTGYLLSLAWNFIL